MTIQETLNTKKSSAWEHFTDEVGHLTLATTTGTLSYLINALEITPRNLWSQNVSTSTKLFASQAISDVFRSAESHEKVLGQGISVFCTSQSHGQHWDGRTHFVRSKCFAYHRFIKKIFWINRSLEILEEALQSGRVDSTTSKGIEDYFEDVELMSELRSNFEVKIMDTLGEFFIDMRDCNMPEYYSFLDSQYREVRYVIY